jgi:hypothetical protein
MAEGFGLAERQKKAALQDADCLLLAASGFPGSKERELRLADCRFAPDRPIQIN